MTPGTDRGPVPQVRGLPRGAAALSIPDGVFLNAHLEALLTGAITHGSILDDLPSPRRHRTPIRLGVLLRLALSLLLVKGHLVAAPSSASSMRTL